MEVVGFKDCVLNYNEIYMLPKLLADIESQPDIITSLSIIKLANEEIAAEIPDVLSLNKE